ncbi:MAG: DUF305 domain-containing protein [Chthoniobacteraceae bacterium]
MWTIFVPRTMKIPLTTLLALLASAILPQASFGAEHEKKEHGEHKDPMTERISRLSGDEFEAAYLAMMTLHHQGGVKMGKLALEKAKSAQLKVMMKKSGAEQQKEIEQMTGWLQEWHKKSPKDYKMPEESVEMIKKSMAELHAAEGEEFDELFSKKMAHHHMGAIQMARLAEDKAKHDETKELSRKIVEMQTKEREELLAIHTGRGRTSETRKEDRSE